MSSFNLNIVTSFSFFLTDYEEIKKKIAAMYKPNW